MRSFIPFIIAFPLVFLIFACEQESLEDIETKTAVVEGYLFAGQAAEHIKVTQSFSYGQEDSLVQTLDDLDIVLFDGEQSYPLFSQGAGWYANPELIIEAEKSYQIEFSWENELISAETYIPAKKEATISQTEIEMEKIEISGDPFGGGPFGGGGTIIDPIDVNWDNSEADYYYVVINNIEENPEYINERVAQFDDENGGRRRFSFISEPQITDFYSINPQRDLTQFGTHQIIVFRVNPEYAGLYESSGNTTLTLVQPPSNIENGLGIFTGVSTDTLYLEVVKP